MNRIAFFLSALFLVPVLSFAQTWDIETKLVAGDRAVGKGFGHVVARTDSLAVITAIYEDGDANGLNPVSNAGAAYIFQKQVDGSWLEVQKIVASDRKLSDRFGQSCAILANTLFIGAEENDFDSNVANEMDNAGAVFVFEKGTGGIWQETQKLVAPDRFLYSYFGCSLDAYGNYLVIGARGDRTDAEGKNPISQCGSAYVYQKDKDNRWTLNKKLTPITRRFYEHFGCDVAIHDKRIVVGAYRDGVSSTYPDRGAAYIFELDIDNEWMPIQKITPTVRTAEKFGWAVDLNKDIIVAGAFENSAGATQEYSETGAAYAFQKDKSTGEWVQMTKFVKSNPSQNDHLGYDVSLYNSYLLITARRENSGKGSIYLFNLNNSTNWNLLQSYTSTHAEIGDYFGSSAAIFDGKIIIGAPGEDHDLEENNKMEGSGSAFILESSTFVSTRTVIAPTLHVFPNPSSGQFKLITPIPFQHAFIQIRDMKGQVLYQKAVQPEEDIHVDLPPGVYHFQLFNDQETLGITKLIILTY